MLLRITIMYILAINRVYILYIGSTISSSCDPIMAALAGIKIEPDADKNIAV